MRVTLFHNENDGHFADGYLPGHPVTEVFTFELPNVVDVREAADIAYQIGNIDPEGVEPGPRRDLVTAYRAHKLRSLSKGDVVCAGGAWLAVATPVGFTELSGPPIQAITLTLLNRNEVIAFINGEYHYAHTPDDDGSDVVIVDLVGRSNAVVGLGETVTRYATEFTIGHPGVVRDRFLRVANVIKVAIPLERGKTLVVVGQVGGHALNIDTRVVTDDVITASTEAEITRAGARQLRDALNRFLRTPPAQPRKCFYIDPTQDPAEHGGYVPSLVVENEAGHSPLAGNTRSLTAPWVWGQDLATAERVCTQANAVTYGLSPTDVNEIIFSSMTAGN
jgi:hypothetical protein